MNLAQLLMRSARRDRAHPAVFVGTTLLLLGAQVIAEYERFCSEGEACAAPQPFTTEAVK